MGIERDFFEIEGLVFGDHAAVYSGVASPLNPPLDLPIGSIYLRTNGELWQNTVTGWGMNGTASAGSIVVPGSGDNQYLVPPPVGVVLSTSFTTSSATYINTGLTVDLLPDSSYWFSAFLLFSSSARNNGIGFAYTTTGSTAFGGITNVARRASGSVFSIVHTTSGEGGVTNDVADKDVPYFAKSDGLINTGPFGGSLTLQIRSEASIDSVSLLQGSALKMEKVI